MKLILLRHGESQWNLENRFTGWKDVDLTLNGINEANFSGNQILREKLNIDSVYTSLLKRATKTAFIVSDIIGFDKQKIKYEWRLNERHYGALQGLNKSETAAKYGEKQVHTWRRSFDIPPPLLSQEDPRNPKFNDKFKKINTKLPLGESLKDVIARLEPFLDKYFNDIKSKEGNHLIVAHSNSLRAIVKVLDNLSVEDILSLNIPTGVPLVYTFDNNFDVIEKEYLIDKEELINKLNAVKNQGKAR